MYAGKTITALDTLGVAISSMMVVFAVLIILFVVIRLFSVIFREKKAEAPAAGGDENELIAVIAAAVAAFWGKSSHPIIRSAGDQYKATADFTATNDLVRDCRHCK